MLNDDLVVLAKTITPPAGFEAPGIEEFFYDPLLLGGTPFAINRIVLMMLLMTGMLCLLFGTGFRKPQVVPRGLQNVLETGTEFVRVQIAEEVIGHEAAKRFAPYLTALFFFIFAFNITSVLPLLHLPINGVIALPLIYAVVTWVLYNYHGVKAQGAGHYIKGSLFPPGIPGPIYLLVTPIEFISTFILRPLDADDPPAGEHARRPPDPRAVLHRDDVPAARLPGRPGLHRGLRPRGAGRRLSSSPSSRCSSPRCRPTSSRC